MPRRKDKRSDTETADLIARFREGYISSEMTVGKAEGIFDRLRDLADDAIPRITKLLESSDEDERRVALTLFRELGDPRAVAPLRRMLSRADASEDEKVVILVTLSELGAPVDEATLRRAIPDPEKLVRESANQMLEVIEDPRHAESFLEVMQQGPPEMQEEYVRDFLGSLDDRRLLSLLTALFHSEHDAVVLAAVDAVERLKEPTTIPLLEERSQYDPSPQVRHAAGNAALRLRARVGDQSLRSWTSLSPLPIAHCFLSTIDGDGGQVLFVARERPEGDFWILDVMFNDYQGVKDCFSGNMGYEELGEMLCAFEPIDFVDISLEQARAELARAYQDTLDAGRRLPPQLLMWRSWLDGEDTREVEEFPLPSFELSRQAELLEACGELVLLDEFESWFFNPDEVQGFISRYRKLRRKGQAEFGQAPYEALIDDAIRAVVGEEWQRLLPDRLRRQAWFLAQLYEEEYVPLWALAAADALEDGVLVEHPLLREMMDESLLNAVEE